MKKREVVGLHIGDRKISICRLKSGSSKEIEKIVDVSLSEKTVRKGIILNPGVLVILIKDAFRKNNIENENVAVAVSGLPLVVRPITSPKVGKEKLYEALKNEVAKYMAGEEPIIDHYSLDKNRMLLLSIKKTLADSILSVIKQAGLNLAGIDVGLFSVLRTLIGGNIDPSCEDTSMLGLVLADKIELGIIRKGLPQYIHSASITNVADIVREIELTKRAYEEEFPQFPVKKTIILDSDADNRNLYSQLAKEIENLEVAKASIQPPGEYDLSQFISLGLALRGKQDSAFDINFLSAEKYEQKFTRKKALAIFIPFILILIVFLLANIMISNMSSSLKEKLIPLEQELNLHKGVLAEVEEIYTTKEFLIKDISYRKKFIDRLKSIRLPQILEDIKAFIPKEVWLTKISHRNEDSIILTGESLSEEAVYKYVNLLYFSNYFQKAEIFSMNTETEGGYPVVHFSIICTLSDEVINEETGENED